MAWRPQPVEPRYYVNPATDEVDPEPDPRFQGSVRHRLIDLKKAAMSAGYVAATPHGSEVALLSWLVEKGLLTFERDRCVWRDDRE